MTVKVKDFTVDAEKIVMKSSKSSSYESKDTMTGEEYQSHDLRFEGVPCR